MDQIIEMPQEMTSEDLMNTLQELKRENLTLKTKNLEDCSSNVCPLCGGRGWVFVDYNKVKECECGVLEQERQDSKLRFASIPETYKDVMLKDMKSSFYDKTDSKEAFKAVGRFVKWYMDHLEKNIDEGKG